jgi:hypothetical protein
MGSPAPFDSKTKGKNPNMAYHVPYARDTFKPTNDMIEGNETADNPVEFDIVPAWGGDLQRIKAIVYSAIGLVQSTDWTPEVQRAIAQSCDFGAAAFINTVTAIRGLTIPAVMALRAGLIPELPTKQDGTNIVPDPEAPYHVTTGIAFSRIAGALPAMALHVASRIGSISDKAEMDPRFFTQPSGFGGTGTQDPAKDTTARTARRTSRRRGTAGKPSTAAGPHSDGKG